jgi:hypothetical protein
MLLSILTLPSGRNIHNILLIYSSTSLLVPLDALLFGLIYGLVLKDSDLLSEDSDFLYKAARKY